MVFQSYNLFPHLTVAENIKLAPRLVKNVSKAEQEELVDEVLSKVGLLEKKNAYPDSMSGGQQQRVADCQIIGNEAKSDAV
jgi:polar amino acid transport system ATP-binding protein